LRLLLILREIDARPDHNKNAEWLFRPVSSFLLPRCWKDFLPGAETGWEARLKRSWRRSPRSMRLRQRKRISPNVF